MLQLWESLGFDIVVDELSEKDRLFCQQAVKQYQSYQEVIWYGDMYRLQSPYEHPYASFQFMDPQKERSIVFSYLLEQRFSINYSIEPVKLKGLQPGKKYRIRELHQYPGTVSPINEERIYSGDYLMTIGFNPDVTRERRSVVLEVAIVK